MDLILAKPTIVRGSRNLLPGSLMKVLGDLRVAHVWVSLGRAAGRSMGRIKKPRSRSVWKMHTEVRQELSLCKCWKRDRMESRDKPLSNTRCEFLPV